MSEKCIIKAFEESTLRQELYVCLKEQGYYELFMGNIYFDLNSAILVEDIVYYEVSQNVQEANK